MPITASAATMHAGITIDFRRAEMQTEIKEGRKGCEDISSLWYDNKLQSDKSVLKN
jgi:hypothetical protein